MSYKERTRIKNEQKAAGRHCKINIHSYMEFVAKHAGVDETVLMETRSATDFVYMINLMMEYSFSRGEFRLSEIARCIAVWPLRVTCDLLQRIIDNLDIIKWSDPITDVSPWNPLMLYFHYDRKEESTLLTIARLLIQIPSSSIFITRNNAGGYNIFDCALHYKYHGLIDFLLSINEFWFEDDLCESHTFNAQDVQPTIKLKNQSRSQFIIDTIDQLFPTVLQTIILAFTHILCHKDS